MAMTQVTIDDTKASSGGGMTMDVNGEQVTLENAGPNAFSCEVNGKKQILPDKKILSLLHESLGNV